MEPTADLARRVESAGSALLALTVAALASVEDRVSTSQLRALLVLGHSGPVNLTTLAEALGSSLSSTSRLVDRLADADLVRRDPAQHTRREIRLVVTSAGRSVLDQVADSRATAIRPVLERMAPVARRDLLAGLEAFAAAATPAGRGAGATPVRPPVTAH